jgi:hypothetical protein
MVDVLEIRKAIGVTRAAKVNKRRWFDHIHIRVTCL